MWGPRSPPGGGPGRPHGNIQGFVMGVASRPQGHCEGVVPVVTVSVLGQSPWCLHSEESSSIRREQLLSALE